MSTLQPLSLFFSSLSHLVLMEEEISSSIEPEKNDSIIFLQLLPLLFQDGHVCVQKITNVQITFSYLFINTIILNNITYIKLFLS